MTKEVKLHGTKVGLPAGRGKPKRPSTGLRNGVDADSVSAL
jgi:hypothetical protein